MNITELIVFVIYLVFMIGIGVYFFLHSKGANEKDYFLAAGRWARGYRRFPPAPRT